MAERGEMFKYSLVDTPNMSWFDMSYDYMLSMNFGELVPSTMMEVIAGDTIHAKSSVFGRLAPMVAPAYGKINLFSYHFYVRNRDIWKSWKAFIDDAEDLEPWQNPSTFVPPIMPYIDIRKTLYKGTLFGNISGNPTGDSDLNEYSFPGLTSHVGFLVIQKDSDGIPHVSIQYGSSTASLPIDPSGSAVIVPFVPNKDEVSNNPNLFYDPFTESTLFDYLGVDMYGVFRQQGDQFVEFLAQAGLTPSDWINGNPEGYDLIYFMKFHALLGMFYGYWDSTWNYVGFDSEGNKMSGGNQDPSLPAAYNPPVYYFDDESSKISSLSLRAYHFCYIEYFRDQNYMKVNENLDFTRDGEDIDWTLDPSIIFDYLTLKYKCWEHDPYTSGLPGPQKGSAVRFIPDSEVKLNVGSGPSVSTSAHNLAINASGSLAPGQTVSDFYALAGAQANNGYYNASLFADLSAATIENFRFQNATQRIAEKMARGGGRYYQVMQILFGEEISAANLDRPIYLGGDKTPIQISEVLQTSASDLTTNQPLGDMAGRAVILGNDDYLEYHCQEHGFYIELCAAIPRVSYQQGLDPMFTRKVRLDYPLEDYAQLGEEAIPTSELYYCADESKDRTVFAYQSRYYQWKYNRDRVAGSFKSSMNHWTFSRIFDSAPVAGKKFLESKPDYRQFAVTDTRSEHLYLTMWHDIQVNRSLPVFGVPTL